MVKVVLEYDESSCKWDPYVEGVKDSFEARHAFSAAVQTMQMLEPGLLPVAMTRKEGERYKIIPGAVPGSAVMKASGTFLEKPNADGGKI